MSLLGLGQQQIECAYYSFFHIHLALKRQINTFIHFHTWFQTKMAQKPYPKGRTHIYMACIWEYPWGFNIIMEITFCSPYFRWSYHRMIQTQIDRVKRKNGNQWQHTKEASSETNYGLSWHHLSFYPSKHAKHPVWWIKGRVVRIPRQAILHKTNLKYGHRPNRYQAEFI